MAFAEISAANNGDNTIVSGVTGKRIRVTGYLLVASGAVNAKWKSAGNDLSGAIPLAAQTVLPASVTPSFPGGASKGWLETNPGEDLILNLSGATLVAGHLSYEYANC